MQNTHTKIESDADYMQVVGILDKRSLGVSVLRALMRTLESYRSQRKYGWSRPWNKFDLKTFCALRFVPTAEPFLLRAAIQLHKVVEAKTPDPTQIRADCGVGSEAAPEAGSGGNSGPAASLWDELCSAPEARGFLFLHERTTAGQRYEGVTVSLGRPSPLSKRHRDRYDIVIERELQEGGSSGSGSSAAPTSLWIVRIYEDRFNGQHLVPKPTTCTISGPCFFSAANLQETSLDLDLAGADQVALDEVALGAVKKVFSRALAWASEKDRHWSHWTQDFIEHFGPQQFPSESVCFKQFPRAS